MTTVIASPVTVGESGLVQLPTAASGPAKLRRLRMPRWLERLSGVVALLAVWELAAKAGWISPQVLAGPSAVWRAGVDLTRSGALTSARWASLQRVLWGLAIGVPLGAVLALASGLTRIGDDFIDSNIQMLRFVPIIGLQSLLILWLGIGETTKVALIVLGVVFPVYINASAAIRSLDPGYMELAEVVGLSWPEKMRKVVLPGVLPGFLVGLRMAAAVAWLLLVFAEQVNARSGLGYLMVRAQTFFQSDVIVVCLAVYALLGLVSDAIIRALERVLLSWQPGR